MSSLKDIIISGSDTGESAPTRVKVEEGKGYEPRGKQKRTIPHPRGTDSYHKALDLKKAEWPFVFPTPFSDVKTYPQPKTSKGQAQGYENFWQSIRGPSAVQARDYYAKINETATDYPAEKVTYRRKATPYLYGMVERDLINPATGLSKGDLEFALKEARKKDKWERVKDQMYWKDDKGKDRPLKDLFTHFTMPEVSGGHDMLVSDLKDVYKILPAFFYADELGNLRLNSGAVIEGLAGTRFSSARNRNYTARELAGAVSNARLQDELINWTNTNKGYQDSVRQGMDNYAQSHTDFFKSGWGKEINRKSEAI